MPLDSATKDSSSDLPEVMVMGGLGSGSSSGSDIDLSQLSTPSLSNIGVDDVSENSSAVSALSAGLGGSSLSGLLSSVGITGSNLGALAPELAIAGVGLAQAKGAQSDAAKQAAQLQGPSQNLINEGQSLISNYNNQKLTPTQQSYVDFTSSEGQALIDSGAGLKAIATQAFGDYASGTLPQADEIALQQQVAAQKQQIASQLSQSGMQDSSVLSAYNQQIDNQAIITRQQKLDARFQTGVGAYNTWLNSTTAGIQLKTQGAQFAQSAFESMMNDGLALESQGMSGLTQAIALTVQSDNQLSASVSQLMGNLAASYAYTASGGGKGGAVGGSGGSAGGGILGSIINAGKTANNAYNQASSLFGSGVDTGLADSMATGAVNDIISDTGGITDLFSAAGGGAAAAGLQGIGTSAVAGAVADSEADAAAALGGGAASGSSSALGNAAPALGVAAAGYSLYNEIENWQSGATGSDTLAGAETGAAIGTAIMPGIGTAIGAIGGALAGAISSLFGGGRVDPENANFNNYTQAYNKAPANMKSQVAAAVSNPYVALAGYFDLRSGQMKGQNPVYQKYGRMGEQKFTSDLVTKVQQGKAAGITDSTKMWATVVQPWINSMGTWQDSNKDAMTALMQNMTGQIMGGTYQQNFKSVGGSQVFK